MNVIAGVNKFIFSYFIRSLVSNSLQELVIGGYVTHINSNSFVKVLHELDQVLEFELKVLSTHSDFFKQSVVEELGLVFSHQADVLVGISLSKEHHLMIRNQIFRDFKVLPEYLEESLTTAAEVSLEIVVHYDIPQIIEQVVF